MLQGKDISQCKVHCTEMQCKNGRERERERLVNARAGRALAAPGCRVSTNGPFVPPSL
jgi:hypothetical protein